MAEQISECTGCASMQQGAICIHTSKITDVCLDKDCIEDLRVYQTETSQALLDSSAGARVRSVELLLVSVDVEELSFQRGYYSIDLTFYYRVRGDATANGARTGQLEGVAVFQKRVVLCGGEGGTKIYSSRQTNPPSVETQPLPEAIVEVLDPMILSSRVVESSEPPVRELTEIPDAVRDALDGEVVFDAEGRRMFVTIGQFSTIRLEREAQLTIPNGRDCIPQKSCCAEGGCQEDPCDLFSRIDFPYDAFYPRRCSVPEEEAQA